MEKNYGVGNVFRREMGGGAVTRIGVIKFNCREVEVH